MDHSVGERGMAHPWDREDRQIPAVSLFMVVPEGLAPPTSYV